jgi:Mg-chelatase subunit ChlD
MIQLKVDSDPRQHDSAVRMTQVVQQFATMLVGRKIGVRLSDSTIAPAWSTSNTIEFSEPQLPDLQTADGVLSVRGLTFHELSHILFTPRAQADISLWVRDNGLGSAFNALEDQRIETLTVAKYQALADWLTATMAQYLLDSPEAIAKAFPLIRGRKYLPVELRALVRQAYVNQQDVAELSSIIDEYRLCLFPQDTERAKPLIARYAELVKDLPQSGQGRGEGLPDPFGHESRPDHQHHSSIKDKPLSKSEQERARAKAQAQDTEVEDEEDFNWGDTDQPEPTTNNDQPADSQPADSDSSDSEPADSGADSDSDSDSEGQGDESEDEGDGQSSSDSASDSQPESDTDADTDSVSAGIGSAPKAESVLKDILNDIKDTLGSAIAEEVAKFGGDVVLQGAPAPTPRRASSTPAHVSGEAVRASVEFKQELEKLKAEFDPAWERKTRKGRLNPLRYAQGIEIDELFDKFETGRDDAVDIEAVILLDTSGSMSGDNIQRASEAMWGLKRALDAVQANCSVVTFDWSAELLYEAGETASTVMRFAQAGGGTSPLEALQYANHVLATSDRKVKVLFVITDGAWGESERSERIIKNLRDGGVLTALAFIGGAYDVSDSSIDSINRHECEAVAHIAGAKDLLSVGREVVRLGIARNLVNA